MADPQKRTYSSVYNALKQISDEEGIDFGLDGQTEEQFKQKYFTGPGNINNLYNKLSQISDEEGVDFGLGTRDEWLGSFGFTEEDAKPRQGYQPTPEEMAGFQQTIKGAGRTAGSVLPSFDAKASNLQKRQGLNVPQRVEVGKSNNLVQGRQQLNPETGELENTYVTSAGNEYESEYAAETEQQAIDKSIRDQRYKESLPGQLDDAYAERDRLNDELAKIQGQWVDQDGRVHYGNRGNDETVAALEAALRQNQQRITALEAERDDDGSTQFWRGFLDAAKNPSVQSFGMTDFNDMLQLMRIKNKMDSAIESGQQPQLTDAEQALMQSTFLNNYAQSQYGENRGFMYRAGGISMQALPFVAEFMMTGGFGALTEKGAELGTRAAEKLALQGLSKTIVKNLGVVAGDVAAGWAMANTTGLFRTAGDIMQRNMGGVTMNPEGNYDFGEYDEEGNFHRGGKSLGRSIYETEVANTLEYYTEKLGEHLKLGKRLAGFAEKHGLSKLSKVVNYLSGSKWLEAGGIQDYPSEVIEEEANLLLNAVLVGDNNFKGSNDPNSVFNKKTQLDIWGGMLFSIGLMQAPRIAQTGYSAAGYYAYKKNVDLADSNASIVFGTDNWQMIKDEIDNCENDKLSDLMQTVIDGDMNDMQKHATLSYAANLVKMRGYNMGMMAGAKDESETMSEKGAASQAVNQSYVQGHETQEPDLMKQFNDEAMAASQNLSEYGEEFTKLVTESENPVETMDYLMRNRNYFADDQIAAAADFYQKQARAQGVMDGALDRVDTEVERLKAEARANTHQQTGNVVLAKGAEGADYYIIGGDIVTDPDTGLTSLAGTGGAVVVRDQLGNVSVKSPQEIMIYSMQPSEQIQNYYDTEVRQQLMQQADDDITYGSPANEVYQLEDTVTLNDGEGNTIEGEIGMMPNAVDGVYVVYTSDGKAMQLTADELNRRIVAHNGMEVQRVSPQNTPNSPQNAQNSPEIAQNSPENLQNSPNLEQNQPQPAQSGAEAGGEPVSALSKIPVLTDEKGKPVLNRKGKPQYQWHKASVEDAAAALIETTGGDMVMARDTASDLVKNAQAGLEKIRKQKPKGDDPIEIAESRLEIRRQEQDQQAIIKQWQDVNQAIQKQMRDEAAARQAEIEAAKSEEQRQREAEEARIRKEKQDEQDRQRLREAIERDREKRNREYDPLVKARQEMADDAEALAILNDTEPRDLQEWVSSMIRPHSMLWQDASESEVGLQSELGLKRADMNRFMSLLGNKENGAKPFGKVVLDIHEGLPEAMKDQYTDVDVRNALLDLFNEGSSTRMMHLTEENRIAEARDMMQQNLLREAEAELESWAEANHLTPEEREAFEDYLAQAPSEPEIEIINNIIADNEYKQSIISEEEDRQSDTRTDVSGSEGGESQVQQAAQAASNGDNEAGTAQRAEAPAGEQTVSDATVSGEGSVIPTPEVDIPRFKTIRRNLADAYSAVIDRGGTVPENLQAVRDAAKEVLKYVDEGLDSYNPKEQEYYDEVQDYNGTDPEILADQYITRVFLDRYCDDDADEQYIRTGLKPDMRRHNTFVEYKGKKFEANDVGICINPNVIEMHKEKNNVSVGFEIRTALSDKGWVGATSVGGSTYGWGSGVSAGWYDKYFDTEAECQAYWAQQALDYLKQYNDPKMKKYEVALQAIIDKGGKKKPTPIKPSEQLKPTDQRDVVRPESAEIGVNEANAKARQAAGEPQPIGTGDFGPIYDQFRGKPKDAIDFLVSKGDGEALGALSHKDIGEIDLVWGEEGTGHSDGYGLAKLVKYHPEVLDNLQEILDEMEVVKRTDNRINLESDKYKAAVRLTWNEQSKTWLLTIFEKKNSALDNTTDTGKTSDRGKRNDTATPQSTVSEDKDTKNSPNLQEKLENSSQKPQNSFKRPGTNTPEGEILVKGGTNLYTKDGAIVNVIGSNIDKEKGERKYTCALYENEESYKKGLGTPVTKFTIDQKDMRNQLASGEYSKTKPVEQPAQPKKKEPKRLVSDDKMEELRKKLIDKLNNLNAGVDPEMMLLGAMYAVGNIERGFTKFADYAREMINGLNDKIRPYLKAFYNAVRDMPEAAEYASQMDDYQTVANFDVYNFDKQQTPDVITKAEQVVKEQKINKQAKKIKNEQPDLFAGDLFGTQEESQPIGKTSSKQEIKAEEAKVDTNPSEAQKEAGNYQKGHINIDGYDITIENPKGSIRRGTDASGKPWETEMHNTYGYIKGTEGVDGDHIDVFLSDNPASGSVYVVDQINPATNEFDEHKVMYGFGSEEEAREAYLANYSKGWKGLGNITEASRETFKEWINSSHRKTKPFAEYALIKKQQPKTFRPATEKDLEAETPIVYYNGKPYGVMMLVREGSQTENGQFEKPRIARVILMNGQSVNVEDLSVETKTPAKKKNSWWQDPNRPESINPSDYKTYMTPEARDYFANYVSEPDEKGRITDFTKWAHPNLAYITAAVWDEVEIPYEDLKNVPEIVEAEKIIKNAEAKGKLEISDEEANRLAQRLIDSSEARQERKALVIIGLPAGGKSSVFANPLAEEYGARIIDSDDVKPWLEGFDGGNGAGYVQDASAEVAERAIDIAVKNGDNIIIPRIGGKSVMDLSAALRLAGYDVQLYFNDVKGVTSIDRAASRFAQTGRYLSLDYLTKKAGVPSENFSKFAEETIGGYLDERSKTEVQNIQRRVQGLRGELYGSGSGLWESLAAQREGTGEAEGTVQADLGGRGLQTGGDGVSLLLSSPLFNYAEWKSNDVPFGQKPKEIWNSESGKPLSDVTGRKNENKRKVSEEPRTAGEGTGQASGSAGRTGAEPGTESDRTQRTGSGYSVETPLRVPNGREARDSSEGPREISTGGSTRDTASALPKHNNRRNNVGERGKDYAPLSPKARFNANVEAIKLMRLLIDEGIEAPTKDQMEALRQYSGWGGMGTFFNDESSAENKILRDLLTDEEYNDAAMSINSAYYTPAMVIDSLWDIAKAMGFNGGNVLEGSAGIGNIIGQMPKDMSRRSDIEAVEIDSISGNILKLLYPDAKVHIQGFQDTVIPNGTVDLAVTNVPFVTGLHVIDKVDKDLSRKFVNIHDFCIAKNIRKLREGGIGLFITSAGTLDKSTKLREWITDEGQADVVGAFRLNNKTFGGTTVTSDIIVVRKRTGNQKSPVAIDISKASPLRIGSWEDKFGNEHQVSMVVNDYFRDHPDMMAGEMAFGYEKGDTFRPGSYGLYPVEGMDQNKMLADFAKSMSKAKETAAPQGTEQKPEPNQLTAEKEGRMLVDDKGRLCVSQRGVAVPLGLNDQKVKGHTKAECFADYQTVQKAVDDVLQQQLNDPDDAALKPKLDALNKAYDKFTKRYGTLHKNTAISFLRNDIDFPSFQALENYSETKDIKGKVTVKTAKTPLFSQRVLGFKTEPKPKSVKDALIASIFRSNGIDLAWITDKLNESGVKPPQKDKWSEDDVRKGILVSRLGFEDPSTGKLEIRYKYLSGNVREKLAIAEGYNTDGKYSANIEELRKAVPMDIPSHLIDFSLGSSWIPVELYKDYLKETLDLSNVKLSHVEGNWVLDEGYSYHNEKNRSAGVYSEKFRETIYGHQLVAAALNNRPVKVSKQVSEGYGSSKTTRTVVDQAATQACAVRVDEIKDEFKQWAKKRMQEDHELAQRIEKIYNDKFNALVPMQIDDEFLPETFDGANMNISLYEHQKRGVMRGLTAPTMLAHEVGTGKSFTLISTAMEMRRLGTAKKPMIVVQNATVAQLTSDAKLLYPNAKVLSLSEKDRSAEGRRAFYAKIKFNDWDLIIVPQSTFERIPDSPERELQFIQEKIDEKKHVIEAAEAAGMDSREIQRLKKELEKIEQEYGDTALDHDPANIDKSQATKKKKKDAKREAASLDKAETKAKEMLDRAVDDVQFFDDLGVDALLVDEAHEYKHLGFQTSIGRGIKGIDPSYSKKCAGLYNKTRSVFEKAGWKNVVFATGTPISNTAAEIWTFMKYLMPVDVMKANDIYYFDDFVHNFGNISQMLEFATSGKFKENTRFAAYVNKPELIRIWSQVADTVLTKEVGAVKSKVPEKEGGKDQDVFLPQSPSLVQIMAAVRAELERFENMDGKQKKENSHIPLTMYGIAKRAAIDPRLVNEDAPDEPLSKTNAAVKEIVKDLKATQSYKGTVAVFCDNQNRKGADGSIDFNIYDDMREKLIAQGVPADQIAIIKSGMSIVAKQKVFDAVNSGAIRVVLGSTQTLGTGVNMQERLHLLIHMDAPDRPMDYTQRNGRIERQGNLHKVWNKPIRIIRFGVEDSLDVTAYQRLKTKSGFIDSIMDGKGALLNNQVDRTVEEEEEGLFDNPVAVLSGSQYALKKNQAERELRKYQGKKAQWEADQVYITNTLRYNKSALASTKENIDEEEKKLAKIRSMFPDGKVKTITVEGVKIDMTKDSGAKMLGETIKEKINDPVNATVKKLRENTIYNDENQQYTIELDGHPVNFTVSIYRTSEWDGGKMKTVIHKGTSYSSPDLQSDSMMSGRSVRDYLDEIIDEVVSGRDSQDRIEAYSARIERINAENEQLSQREGQPFQFNKELEAARKNVDEYTELMKQEMKDKEAKYAEQQKEAEASGNTFNLAKAEESSEEDELYRADEDEELTFFSNAMMAVESLRQEKATPEQWLSMITKAGGLKAAEDKWLGLSEWLENSDKRTLTKDEIIDYISENQVDVEDVTYGRSLQDRLNMEFYVQVDKYRQQGDNQYLAERKAMNDLDEKYEGFNKAMYLVHLEDGGEYLDFDYDYPEEVKAFNDRYEYDNVTDDTRRKYTTEGLENNREIALIVPSIDPYRQDDEIHFGDAGDGRAVAWIRFGETTFPADGGAKRAEFNRIMADNDQWYREHPEFAKYGIGDEALKKESEERKKRQREALAEAEAVPQSMKVLVIDEIQSKRHQDARKFGYRLSSNEMKKQGWKLVKAGNTWTLYDPDGKMQTNALWADNENEAWKRVSEVARDLHLNLGGSVPAAPFEKNWHELAMKRMLRYAAENGYDFVAWTTGIQQVKRYSIGQIVSSVDVSRWGEDVNGYNIDSDNAENERGVYLNITNRDNIALEVNRDGIVTYDGGEGFKGHNIAEVVGKDLAVKILGTEGRDNIYLGGLRIGGEGMKGFYDDILPLFMNKYGKKWGVQVHDIELPQLEPEARRMHSVEVTPAMRQSVLMGQPMFREIESFENGESFPIRKTTNYSSYNVLGTRNSYSVDLLPDEYATQQSLLDAVRNVYPEYFVTLEDDSITMQSWESVMTDALNLNRQRKAKGTEAYQERKTRNALNAIKQLADMMHLNVEVLTTTDGLTGKKARSKGFFNPKTGKITIVLPNHRTQSDVIKTLLHEGVAHFGLRNMFGEHFNTFLDNVYNNAEAQIKARIDAAVKRNGWSRHVATEEYLARLAERTDFENAVNSGWWKRIKDFFVRMLAEAGLRLDAALSDNDLRYILWRSYDNLIHPNDRRNIFDKAREVQMQSRLKVGEYAEPRRTAQAPIATPGAAEPQEMLNSNISNVPSQELLLSLSQKEGDERNETIDELAKRVGSGEARIVRLGEEMERGRRTLCHRVGSLLGSQFLAESENSDGTLGAGMHQGTLEAEGQKAKEELQVKSDILSWAKRNGYYIDEKDVERNSLDGKIFRSAAESNVYRTKDGKKVIKFMVVSNYYRHGLLKRMDDLALQNALLSDPLDVIGFSENNHGQLCAVLQQDFVEGETVFEHFEGDTNQANDYIDVYLSNILGLREWYDEYGDFDGIFTRKGILYKDIHGGNVIIDKEGNRHIIDCQTEYKSDRYPNERMSGFSIEDNDQDEELYSIRTKEPPKKTGKGYKVFVLKNGQLYPPMVANPNGEGTPIGVWLDADAAPVAGTSKTGRPQVKAGGKGTQGGSGQLAYRPGWHLGEIPYALQFNRKDENGERTLFPNNFVWAEVEYADDVDYQKEAHDEGMNANGKYQHSLAGLKHVPVDGSYKYRTNPDPNTDEWVITGAMRVNKILSREEVDELVRKAGREPQKVQEGDVLDQESVDALNDQIKAMKEADEMGLLYRDDDEGDVFVEPFEDNLDIARNIYEEAAASDALKFQESWQDKMAGLKILQNAIEKETGNKATGAEDAYLYENRMHGKAKNQSENFDRRYYQPILKAADKMMKAKGWTEIRQLTDYMVAKHGLERNIFYAFKEAVTGDVRDTINKEQQKLSKQYERGVIDALTYKKEQKKLEDRMVTDVADKIVEVHNDPEHIRMKEDYEAGRITYSDYITNEEDLRRKYTPDFDEHYKDYSGLTELTGDDSDYMTKALAMVEDAEKDVHDEVSDLWDAVNAATKETLRFAYESGTMSRSTYNNVRAMFDYYIPLRGWAENNANDFYEYVSERNVFSNAIKKAYGRESLAENPIAYIGNMAVSTLLAGHRNQMKQHFLNYVMNNPTSLVSVSEKWWENKGTETSPYWVEVAPEIPANATADEIADIVEQFNKDMQEKAEQGKATTRRGSLSIKYHATGAEKNEHMVEVQRAGKTYQLYINGNPKAAQALNGINEKAVSRISQTDFGKLIERINRSMAAFFTSKNPAFVLSNLSRDLTMAGASVAIKEDAAYNAQFIKNVFKVLRPRTGRMSKYGLAPQIVRKLSGMQKLHGITGLMPSLMRKYLDGDLDLTNETERLFGEFMDEGAETGFVNMLSVDSFKDKMQKEIARMQGITLNIGKASKGTKETPIGKGLRMMGDIFEFYNRCAEDATRFIVYMTSRQMGKSLEDSIADAKDVTLNFNRKGTGAQWNAVIRDLFIFVNPAIQALSNMFKMAYKHPIKFTAVTAGFVAAGALMPIFNQWLLNLFGDDDDKETYWNLPPWVRKNNLVLWVPGTKNFITIPLAQEFRVFYGLGEMMSSLIYEHPVHDWPIEILSSFMDLIPINPTGNGGNLAVDLTPTMLQPLMQLHDNVDFTGKPIWKENQGNKHAPMYTKAYVTTPEWMVSVSEAVNDLTGGNEGKKGWIEDHLWQGNYINNPAVWNHLMQGYFGGMYNTIAKGFDVGVTLGKGEMPKIYQTPVVNRFLNRPVERDNAGVLGDDYYKLIDERDKTKYELRTWQKKALEGEEGAQEHVDEIMSSEDYQRMLVIDHYDKIMKDLKAGEKAATMDIDKADIKESITMYKAEMLEELAEIDGGTDPLEAAKKKFDEATTFAEKNRLRMRIEKLMARDTGSTTKKRGDEVEKALSYRSDDDKESHNVNDEYLKLATAENIADDARIRAAKQKIKGYTDRYKELVAKGRATDAANYRKANLKWFTADQIIQNQSRALADNRKLLGKGHDAAIMKLIDGNRQRMLKAIKGLE